MIEINGLIGEHSKDYDFLIAEHPFGMGDLILALGNVPAERSDPKRLQVDEDAFILPPAIICHSCDPNAYIDWETMELKALRSIQQDETITYHYGTSEDEYSIGQFDCECKSPECVGLFSGYKYLIAEQRLKIRQYISPFLKKKYE